MTKSSRLLNKPISIDVEKLEADVNSTPTQNHVIKMFAFGVAGNVAKEGNVKQFDILALISLIVPLITGIVTKCAEHKLKASLQRVNDHPNGLYARWTRFHLKNQIESNQLDDQQKYELVKGVISKGVDYLNQPEMWDGMFGRFQGWSPHPTSIAEPAQAVTGQPEAQPVAVPEAQPVTTTSPEQQIVEAQPVA